MNRKIVHMVMLLGVLLIALPLSAQHYIGFKAGYGAAQGRFYPKYETAMTWSKYTGGIAWKYYSDQQIVGGIVAELEYQTRGYKIFEGIVSDTTNYVSKTRIVNSLTVPFMWQPHLYFLNRRLRVFLNIGFTVSYNTGLGDKMTRFDHTVDAAGMVTTSSVTTDYKFITARDNRWNYGISGGFGMGVLFGRCEIFVEGRYYYGMSDIIRNNTKYIFQRDFLRSELDNLFVSVGFFFRLGKGGIKAPPLKLNDPARKKARQNGGESDFRNIKLNL